MASSRPKAAKMNRTNGTGDSERGGFLLRAAIFPRSQCLHAPLRIALGAALNLALALRVIPELGKTANAGFELLAVALPAIAIPTLMPVICMGRNVPRLIAIGLCLVPAYVLAVGCVQIITHL
jgi:hypothetical protein